MFVKENPGIDHAQNDSNSPDPDGPMNNVSWYDAAAYCNWLSRREGLPECYEPNEGGKYAAGMKIKPDALRLGGYRLPTEAEWEYACRAGAKEYQMFHTGNALTDKDAKINTDPKRPVSVGSYKPNAWGLYDMHGNVWEWCEDKYVEDYHKRIRDSKALVNPLLKTDETVWHSVRGGSWQEDPEYLRSAHELLTSAWRFAETAAAGRLKAISSGEIGTAWEASSAAAGPGYR